MKEPNYGPPYCAMYPSLAKIARKHGYALSIHGTLARDMDLVCIPWAETVSEPKAVLDEITSTFALRLIGGEPTKKSHGRIAYTISVAWGECAIDISFMPSVLSAGQVRGLLKASADDANELLKQANKQRGHDSNLRLNNNGGEND